MLKISKVFNTHYFYIVFAVIGFFYVSPANAGAMIAQILGAHYCEAGTTNCCNEVEKQVGLVDLKNKCLYQEECMYTARNDFCRESYNDGTVSMTKDIARGKLKVLIIDYKCGPGSGPDGGVPIFKLFDQRQEIAEGFSKPLSCKV